MSDDGSSEGSSVTSVQAEENESDMSDDDSESSPVGSGQAEEFFWTEELLRSNDPTLPTCIELALSDQMENDDSPN